MNFETTIERNEEEIPVVAEYSVDSDLNVDLISVRHADTDEDITTTLDEEKRIKEEADKDLAYALDNSFEMPEYY